MKDFYISYCGKEKLTALLAEISWTHHIQILEKCINPLEREFYIRMSKRNGWSYRTLVDQIENKMFERMMASQENFEENLPKEISKEAKLSVKDEYAFDFLALGDEYTERELERAVGRNIESFLREVGNAYTFVGSQYRLEVGGQEFFIDILLYHRKLKSLVAIELKRGAFIPEYVGKMQFYLAVLNDTVRLHDENPSIGIILCREKNRMIVEYALKDSNKPIIPKRVQESGFIEADASNLKQRSGVEAAHALRMGDADGFKVEDVGDEKTRFLNPFRYNVASYKIVQQLPQELKDQLPTPEQIEKLVEYID